MGDQLQQPTSRMHPQTAVGVIDRPTDAQITIARWGHARLSRRITPANSACMIANSDWPGLNATE